MTLFLSTFVNKIDRKGRVSVPASFRPLLAGPDFSGVVLFRSWKHPALEGYRMGDMQELARQVETLDTFSDSHDDAATSIFADARPLPFDAEGRIILPEDLVAHAGLGDAACFAGRGRTFQIWEPKAFQLWQAQARQRVQQAGLTLKSPV